MKKLTGFDVSKNTALTYLGCSANQLTSLDVTKNIVLKNLRCNSNQLITAALNALFGTLNSNTIADGKFIDIRNNPGTAGCNQSIATAKGWSVNTTPQQ